MTKKEKELNVERLKRRDEIASKAIERRDDFIARFGFKPSWSQTWDEQYALMEYRDFLKRLKLQDYLRNIPEEEDTEVLYAYKGAFLTAFFS